MAISESQLFQIAQGWVDYLVALDVGVCLNIEGAAALLRRIYGSDNVELRQGLAAGGTPIVFGDQLQCLRVVLEKKVELPNCCDKVRVEVSLWDFAALVVHFRMPLEKSSSLEETSKRMQELEAKVRTEHWVHIVAEQIVGQLGSTIAEPSIAPIEDDYGIVSIESFGESVTASFLRQEAKDSLSRLIWNAEEKLSRELQDEIFTHSFSARDSELVIVDWERAFVFGGDMEAIRHVLEFTLVQALEMRLLVNQLDQEHSIAHRAFRHRGGKRATDTSRVAQAGVDAAWLFGQIAAPLNFVDEREVAHVYALAARRFELEKLDAVITREVAEINEIYEKMIDRRSHHHSLMLEIIVVLLIVFEILLALEEQFGRAVLLWLGF